MLIERGAKFSWGVIVGRLDIPMLVTFKQTFKGSQPAKFEQKILYQSNILKFSSIVAGLSHRKK